MSTATEQFKTELIGQPLDPSEFEVEAGRIRAYAAATNDRIGPHAAGEYASPLFAVVPSFAAFAASAAAVTPPELLMRVVHGEQDMRFHSPVLPGMTLVSTATPIGIHKRSSGVVVGTHVEIRDRSSNELLVDEYLTAFFRGADEDVAVGEEPPGHSFNDALREREPDAEVVQTFDADQTYRYAEASGDPMPIHTDDDMAKAMGLPGIIIHGLCTMAFTSVGAIENFCPEDPQRLKRLAVRFSRVLQPEQTITTRYWRDGETDGREVIRFETTSDAGEVAIKDGLAEIAP